VMTHTRARERWLRALALSAPAALVVVAIAVLNSYWYGAPSNSGYGAAANLYAWPNVWPNVKLYAGWLMMSESPIVVIAAAGLAIGSAAGVDRRVTWLCAAMSVLTFASYVAYFQWDAWWYLRFLTPAAGAFAVLIACGFKALSRALPLPYGRIAATVAFAVFLAARFRFMEDNVDVRTIVAAERRYVDVGEYVANTLPSNAALFSMQHSGSLRLYSGRLTLRFDWIQPDEARGAPALVERAGYHPYLIVDDTEQPQLRQHWGLAVDAPLPWPIVARRSDIAPVTVFDLAATAPHDRAAERIPRSGEWCGRRVPLVQR